MADEPTRAMQRVRIGLTGLAFVFLAVLLAMVFTREPSGETEITPNLLEQQMTGSNTAAPEAGSSPAEPLAELGVAPGKAEANAAETEPQAAQSPRR